MTPLPPPPPSGQPPMPRPRRKTSLRTVSGTAQDLFRARLLALRGDPTVVLPEPVGEEAPVVRRLRRRLERMGARGPGLLDRLDRRLVGAVAKTWPLADRAEFPRLLDARVAGNRRFYLPAGHAERACALGVQNHDDPLALLMAWRTLAKRHRLHLFASRDGFWCSGAAPRPPADWFSDLAEKAGLRISEEAPGRWGCGHADRPRALLRFRGGPALAACGACGKRADGLHRLVRERYAGPGVRQPVDLAVLRPDGGEAAPSREAMARYRAGIEGEDGLVRSAG